MALIYDVVDVQELTGFVRGVQLERELNVFQLSRFLPNENIDDIEYRVVKGGINDQDVASIRAWDTESPIGSRQGISRLMGELPPISKKIRLGEEERLRRRSLDRGGDIQQIADAIYADADNMARAVAARIELLRGEALYSGALNINENGVIQTVNFGRSGTHSVTLTGADLWSAYSTSDPVKNLLTWQQTYVDTNGVKPAICVISTTALNHLLLNDKIRTIASSISGAPSILSEMTLNTVLSAYGLPPLWVYDTKVRIAGTATRVIPADKVIFVPPAGEPLGRTFIGTTAESLELAGANQMSQDDLSGMVAVVEKTFDPVATWTKAAVVALPVMVNPDLTFVADVY